MKKEKKPSDFKKYPWSSILGNSESETIALNIMKILSRTGNEFRLLEWDEYKIERLKDGNFSESEKNYFKKVVGYCWDQESANNFSKHW